MPEAQSSCHFVGNWENHRHLADWERMLHIWARLADPTVMVLPDEQLGFSHVRRTKRALPETPVPEYGFQVALSKEGALPEIRLAAPPGRCLTRSACAGLPLCRNCLRPLKSSLSPRESSGTGRMAVCSEACPSWIWRACAKPSAKADVHATRRVSSSGPEMPRRQRAFASAALQATRSWTCMWSPCCAATSGPTSAKRATSPQKRSDLPTCLPLAPVSCSRSSGASSPPSCQQRISMPYRGVL